MKILNPRNIYLEDKKPYLSNLLNRLAAVADNVAILKNEHLYKWVQVIGYERCEYFIPCTPGEWVSDIGSRLHLLEFLIAEEANLYSDEKTANWYTQNTSVVDNLNAFVKHKESELELKLTIFDEPWKGAKEEFYLDGYWTLFEKLGNHFRNVEEVKRLADNHYTGSFSNGATFEAKHVAGGYWGRI